jgi:hypothetical protein
MVTVECLTRTDDNQKYFLKDIDEIPNYSLKHPVKKW